MREVLNHVIVGAVLLFAFSELLDYIIRLY